MDSDMITVGNGKMESKKDKEWNCSLN